MRQLWTAVLVLGLAGMAGGQSGPATSTRPVQADETRVSPANAKVYLEIGEILLMQFDEAKHAAGTLALPEEKLKALVKLLDDVATPVRRLMEDLKKDPLPERSRIGELEKAMQSGPKMDEVIGKDWASHLRDVMNSPRSQAHVWLREAQIFVPRFLELAGPEKAKMDGVLAGLLKRAEELAGSKKAAAGPDGGLEAFKDVAKQEVLGALTPEQQVTLKAKYRRFFGPERMPAPRGATQPAAK